MCTKFFLIVFIIRYINSFLYQPLNWYWYSSGMYQVQYWDVPACTGYNKEFLGVSSVTINIIKKCYKKKSVKCVF